MEKEEALIEIDIFMMLKKFWRKKTLIVLVGLLFLLVVTGYTLFLKKPLYSSTTKIYSISSIEDDKITIQDLMIGTGLVKDYQQIILSNDVLTKVIKSENINMSVDELSKKIVIDSPQDTRVIDITVIDTNPFTATELANSVRDNSVEIIKDITKIDDITVIEKAKVNKKPINMNLKRDGIIAFFLGVFISLVSIVLKELIDDRVTNSEDVECLDVPVLGIVPILRKK